MRSYQFWLLFFVQCCILAGIGTIVLYMPKLLEGIYMVYVRLLNL